MRHLHALLVATALVVFCGRMYGQEVEFAHYWGSDGHADYVTQTETDLHGNVIVVSRVTDTVFLNTVQLFSLPVDSPAFYNDMLISKFAPDGSLIWSHRIGGCADDLLKFTIDGNNDIILVGYIEEAYPGPCQPVNMDFTGGSSPTGPGGFLAKYDENFNLLWIKKENPTRFIGELATDSSGNIYMTGAFSWSCDFDYDPNDSFILKAIPRTFDICEVDGFLAKYNPFGDFIWAGRFGSRFWDLGSKIIITNNRIVISGLFSNTIDADISPVFQRASTWGYFNTYPPDQIWNDANEPFLASYDLNGALLWFKPLHMTSGTASMHVSGLDFDEDGSIYMLGNYRGLMTLDSANANSSAVSFGPSIPFFPGFTNYSYDVYLAKYDSAGNFLWLNTAGRHGDDGAYDLEVLDKDHIYFSASLSTDTSTYAILPGFDTTAAYQALLNTVSEFVECINSDNQPNWLYYGHRMRFTDLSAVDSALFIGGYFYDTTVIQGVQNSFLLLPEDNITYSNDALLFKIADLSGASQLGNPHFLMFNPPTGIEETSAHNPPECYVYPNPAINSFSVAVGKSGIGGTLRLVDVMGRELTATKILNQVTEISTSAVSAGIYYVVVQHETAQSTKRIVVSK